MMKRLLLPFFLLIGLGTVQTANAQANLIRLGINAAILAKRASNSNNGSATPNNGGAAATPEVAPTSTYQGQSFSMQRTPADKLPKKAVEQITALEAQLDRCHAAMLADPKGVVCTPEQRTAIQSAAVSVARAQSSWDLKPYQQEMAFYMAEDARRQQPATPEPVK
jgi:hypothetical protein